MRVALFEDDLTANFLPLVWLRVFDPTFLVLLLCQGAAFGRSCRNAGLLKKAKKR